MPPKTPLRFIFEKILTTPPPAMDTPPPRLWTPPGYELTTPPGYGHPGFDRFYLLLPDDNWGAHPIWGLDSIMGTDYAGSLPILGTVTFKTSPEAPKPGPITGGVHNRGGRQLITGGCP